MTKRVIYCVATLLLIRSLVGCRQNNLAADPSSPIGQASVALQQPVGPAAAAPAPDIQVPAGAIVRVRIDQALDTVHNRAGDSFTATLYSPIAVDGRIVLPNGTRFRGHVTSARSSGRLKGRAVLGVRLDSFELNGLTYTIDTSSTARVSGRHKKRNAGWIGGGTGVGALIGGLAAGAKGALIGGGAGAAAGTVGALITGKKQISLPAETAMRFTLRNPVRI